MSTKPNIQQTVLDNILGSIFEDFRKWFLHEYSRVFRERIKT